MLVLELRLENVRLHLCQSIKWGQGPLPCQTARSCPVHITLYLTEVVSGAHGITRGLSKVVFFVQRHWIKNCDLAPVIIQGLCRSPLNWCFHTPRLRWYNACPRLLHEEWLCTEVFEGAKPIAVKLEDYGGGQTGVVSSILPKGNNPLLLLPQNHAWPVGIHWGQNHARESPLTIEPIQQVQGSNSLPGSIFFGRTA